MYCDVVNRIDEIKIELEQTARQADQGWRFRRVKSREAKMLTTIVAGLGRGLVAVGPWLAVHGQGSHAGIEQAQL